MAKIDGSSTVPIGWVAGGFGIILSGVIVMTFWVAAVNFRLQRIEQKLGLPPVADHSFVTPAQAGTK